MIQCDRPVVNRTMNVIPYCFRVLRKLTSISINIDVCSRLSIAKGG